MLDDFSTKSSAAPKGSAAAALRAAERTFSAAPSLPLNPDTARDAGAQEGRRRLAGAFFIEIDRIRPDPAQPRRTLDTKRQLELTDSVRQLGILQPITVRYLEAEKTYQIISGERRHQAAAEAGLAEMPCWIQTPREQEVLLRQVVENWQRADLHPLEIADALACLRDANGYTQKKLAQLTGKPESEISRLLSLLKVAPEVQAHARRDEGGTFTRRHLTALARLPSEEQADAARTVQEARLTAADTERLVQEAEAKRAGAKTRGAPFGQRLRYVTGKAVVTLTFRRRNVTVEDILAALDEVRAQAAAAPPEGSAM